MPKVLVSDTLSREGLAVLERAPGIDVTYRPGLGEGELAEAIGEFDGLVIRSGSKVTARVLAKASRLRVIGRAGIGVDNVDVEAASRSGIIVMNTPTGNAVTTAEHAVALLFSLARKIPQADATMKQGKWEKKRLEGRELSGKTLGVVGLGNIGRIVADRARGLHMHVLGFDPFVTKERAAELGVELVELDALFRRADAITVHTPLTDETRALVDDAAIATMKKGVLLVNAARGGIFSEQAILRGLASGQLGGVALDVFVEEPPGLTELVAHPNVVATPHLGASTEEAQLRVAVEIAEQVVAYLTTGEVANSVNVPAVARELAPVLGPYMTLARRLGQFLGQVEDIKPRAIEVECAGAAAELPSKPIVNAALAGLLEKFLEEPVNQVNAPFMARDRGIEVRELKSTPQGPFSTLVTLSVVDADGGRVSVSGTLSADSSPRLARWGAYELEAHLEGAMLATKNRDRPGVIGTIGTMLGAAGVNVSRMQMGRDESREEAAAIWSLDSDPPKALLEKVQHAKEVSHAWSLRVG